MEYIGEHLLPGNLGHLFIIISFVASLVATFAYYKSFQPLKLKSQVDPKEPGGLNFFVEAELLNQHSWRRLARIAFLIDAASVVAIFFILYYLISSHRYEYLYVYKNSGNDLEPKYILSSLWSASEGSFLLWTVWHGILGIGLMVTAKKWEGPVMMVLSFSQVCLATMMLGIYLFDIKIGSSPFALFREQMSDLPIFNFADYTSRITDGNGLNQLLQNYWMVIHPPVLFLGFASTVIPFAYAIGGLWTKNYGDWTKPALPWALFSAAVLGTGVLMGAAWAYESLSFGGYWAWDPVENASMVPWLVLVAGIHTLLIYKHTGRSLRATHLFFILAFILVVYSTFLTRSGVLGDTSVHSFADLGMNFQLFMFIMVFLAPALWLFFTNLKRIPHIQKEEQVSSREFWMFIGSLVLFFSALVIIGKTSVPVVNKIFGTNIAPPAEVEYSYNSIIIWVAIIIGLLTAVVQYLKYKETASKFFLKRILLPIIISAAAIILILGFGNINYNKYGAGYLAAIWIALASSVFAVIANFSYIWLGVKGSLKLSGPSIAHLGFGLMLAGILISSSKKETLSYNTSGIFVNFGEKSNEKPGENLTLVKGQKMDMGKYWVTYEKDSMHPKKSQWYYSLKFENKNGKEIFTLKPNAFINYKGNEGLMANPDAKHYWDHDIFAYITSLPDPEKNKDTSSFNNLIKKTGDSIFYSRGYMILETVKTTDSLPLEIFGEGGKLYEARINVFSKTGSVHTAFPKLAFAKGAFISVPDTITAESLVLQLNKVEGNTVEIGVKESGSVLQYLTLKAYKFPFINVLWLGALLMAAGFIISLVRRVQMNKS